MYQQIEDQIKDGIFKRRTGGRGRPSVHPGVANDLKVSVLTIRRVYEELGGRALSPARWGLEPSYPQEIWSFAGFQAAAGGTERCSM